jgi:hypothetical protein
MFAPAPHPDTECPFYRGAYQNFLIATTPLANGDPAIVNYATIADAFVSAYNTNHQRNTGDPSADPYGTPGGSAAAAQVRLGPASGKAWLGAVHQAGQREVVFDRDGHTLYYGLHMNQAFADFIKANNLQTPAGILSVDPNLQFPPGVVEFKTAWKDIDPRDFPDANGHLGTPQGIVSRPTDFASDPGDYSNYITTMAWLPWLTQDPATGAISEDPEHPILRRVALVAMHCVYTLPGHPEFVWGSIQHVNIKESDPAPLAYAGISVLGMPDTAPNSTGPDGGAVLPDPNDPATNPTTVTQSPDPTHNYLLFTKGTAEKDCNNPIADQSLMFDEASQKFSNPPPSIFRVFPGSKPNFLSPDTAVFSLNDNINVLFAHAIAAGAIDPNVDKRQHYRLVAAVWMDKPDLFGLGIQQANGSYSGLTLQNDDGTNPLAIAGQGSPRDPVARISQGVTCGTPLGPHPLSGDDPNATGYNNTVPGCYTRYDMLNLPDAAFPQFEADGGSINAGYDFSNPIPNDLNSGTDSPFSLLGGEDRLSSTAWRRTRKTTHFTTVSPAITPNRSTRVVSISRPRVSAIRRRRVAHRPQFLSPPR